MRIHFDQSQDALYFRFSESLYLQSEEVKEGVVLDYGEDGEIIGIEILEVSKNLSSEFLSSLLKQKNLSMKVGVF